ncbi:unnamed protein product [Calicophoron daubneyi]|uniref:EGF-like domain-containing protein n=1 Tax=Calicophoron daubneyi TaxID=300641 RepID=A0AAV2T4P7_CALDB
MLFVLAFCLILLISQKCTFSEGKANVFVKFLSFKFEAPTGFCDGGVRSSPCDIYFRICIGRRKSREKCDLLHIVTPRWAFEDQNAIIFGEKMGHMANPIVFSVVDFPIDSYLHVDVYDADGVFDPDDLITTLRIDTLKIPSYQPLYDVKGIQLSPSFIVNSSTVILSENVDKKAPIHLRLALWAQCAPGFFGPSCEKECYPEHSSTDGHFGCIIQTGEAVCIPGWREEKCDQPDICTIKQPCGPMGRCRNVGDGFVCECLNSFSGPLCMQPPSRCQPNGALSGGTPSSPFCLNGGFCVLSPDKVNMTHGNVTKMDPVCICLPGFTGTRCERDVDECSQWVVPISPSGTGNSADFPRSTVLRPVVTKCLTPGHVAKPCCGENSVCVNTPGGYRCLCPLGWSGPHCEFPPTLWPPGYEPPVNTTEDHAYAFPVDLDTEIHVNNVAVGAHLTHSKGWTAAFATVSVLLVILVICLVFYCLRVRRKRAQFWKPGKSGLSVRYVPRTDPLPPINPDQPSLLTETRVFTNSIYNVPRNNACQDRLSRDYKTEYEEIPPDIMHDAEDANETYDVLDDCGADFEDHPCRSEPAPPPNVRSSPVWELRQPNGKAISRSLPIPSEESEFSNMLYLEPKKLALPELTGDKHSVPETPTENDALNKPV